MNNDTVIDEMLRQCKTIAVVGMSNKPERASHHVGLHLARYYKVYPVNPVLDRIDALKCYHTLEEAQQAALADTGQGIDLIDVFRAPEFVPEITDEAIRLGVKYLWLQDDVIHDEAVARAEAAGIKCVQDDCIYRQHNRRLP